MTYMHSRYSVFNPSLTWFFHLFFVLAFFDDGMVCAESAAASLGHFILAPREILMFQSSDI